MTKTFNKNEYRISNEKIKIILDTDPGVDDIACFIYAMNDENIDIKLVTTVAGNIPIEKCTRNALHVMELFGAVRLADNKLLMIASIVGTVGLVVAQCFDAQLFNPVMYAYIVTLFVIYMINMHKISFAILLNGSKNRPYTILIVDLEGGGG